MNPRPMECPYCHEPMHVETAHCSDCGVSVKADFRPSRLSCLGTQDAAFLAEYVISGFSIKEMEKRVGLSYPAIRARLDRIRTALVGVSTPNIHNQEILDRLERGEISADEAIALLDKMS